jgi:predicted MFS family arabinose efflux permease
MPPRGPVRLRYQLAAFTLTRTVLNTGYRMVYPFLPVIARGPGVELSTVALAVTARSSLGLASPFLGSAADVRGRKTTMLFSLALAGAGFAIVSLWPTYPVLFASMLLAGGGKIMFDPAMQAYVGDRVDYSRRGLVIALTEFGWSGAFLIGIPIAGWIIARGGWAAPFRWLVAFVLLAGVLLWCMLPADPSPVSQRLSWSGGMRAVLASRSALAGLALGFLISLANETVNIVFGAWLEDSFGLRVLALGAAAAVIGVAELGGEGLVAALADRLGKRRAVAVGISLSALACLGLPFLGRSLTGALVGLFFVYTTFEFTIVSAMPLMTELVPQARATMMAGNIGAHSCGRAIGALVGPALFSLGLQANGTLAAALNLVALAVLLAFIRE